MDCFDTQGFLIGGVVSVIAFTFFYRIENEFNPVITISDLFKPPLFCTLVLSILYLVFIYKNPITDPITWGLIAERLAFGANGVVCVFDEISGLLASGTTLCSIHSKYKQIRRNSR